MAVEPAFLSLQRPSGTAQVSGTMDPPKEGTKLLSKFPAPGMNIPEIPFEPNVLNLTFSRNYDGASDRV
jgi:hypothetical protein